MSPEISRAGRSRTAASMPSISGAPSGSSTRCNSRAACRSSSMRRSRVASSWYSRAFSTLLRHLRREQRQRAHVVVGEVADAAALQVHHAEHPVLQDQRHRHFRPDVRVRRDVARVLGRVVDAHHFARFRGGAGDALAERHVVDVHPLVVADAEEVPQRARLVVDIAGC